MAFHIIIPAAGFGERMASSCPKQYMLLAGKPMIAHSLQTFFASSRISGVHLALSVEDDFWTAQPPEQYPRLCLHYTGGKSRAETVQNTLAAMRPVVADDDWILVHDAARPGLNSLLLDRLLDTLQTDAVGGLLAMPLADTLKQSDAEARIQKTISREQLWQAQTPQMFRYALLQDALTHFHGIPTDEAQAVEALGLQPKLVLGALRNMKITYPQDLAVVEVLMQMSSQ